MFRYTFWPALALLTACSNPSANESTPTVESKDQAGTTRAKLVLVIVLDQMPSSAILRYASYLPKDGALRRAIEGGMYHERVRYGYAGTNTAPGHASIFTGEMPAVHGIDSNDLYSYEVGARIRIVDDQKSAVFGVEGAFASPFRLLKPTVGDTLRKLDPKSKVVSVSLKARAAVLSGGSNPNFVTWYDHRLPGFTTSTRYAESMPKWLSDWNAANPVSQRTGLWEAADPETYEKLLGSDEVKGESDWYGLGITFPHNTKDTEKPEKTFVATPQSVDYLLDMTRELASRYELGKDEHTDLLCLSVSSTDYVGHSFSTHSWEYMDILLKADKALGVLVDELGKDTELAVVITSDHGGSPLPETIIARGLPGGRMGGQEIVSELEALADKELGEGDWIQTFIQPYLYLSKSALSSEKKPELEALIQRYATENERIEGIYPPVLARSWKAEPGSIRQAVTNTVSASRVALYVVPAQGYVASSSCDDDGTGHGTPWLEDREVPLLAFGTGVTAVHNRKVLPQNRVASTIASLLGIDWHMPAKALPGCPGQD
ncbi:MAG: alkaline phosphatase family protein [Kofleriaceae bacterium]|nr:alkaline phosphatase family protein [Kofleriaceae bacterium]